MQPANDCANKINPPERHTDLNWRLANSPNSGATSPRTDQSHPWKLETSEKRSERMLSAHQHRGSKHHRALGTTAAEEAQAEAVMVDSPQAPLQAEVVQDED